MGIPVYKFNPSLAFPEVPPYLDPKGKPQMQCTAGSFDPVASVTLAMAYLLKGQRFMGAMDGFPIEEIYAEVESFCKERMIDPNRLLDWAESIDIPPEDTLSAEEAAEYVYRDMEGVGFTIDQYQADIAAWCALRLGSIQAMGCGVGKSSTATSAAITAARIGRCSTERCFIICPINAVDQWQPYLIDLRKTFKVVDVISVDSLHHIQGIEREPGGALIIDEAHKLKGYGAERTGEAHRIRPAFQWCVCLTGTLLHTGVEGVLSVQDLACPGLSRYTDPMAFGSAFNCIINKKIKTRSRGFIYRRSLGKPSAENLDVFEVYLARSTRSLRFESDEVKAVFQIPENKRIQVSEFPFTDLSADATFIDVLENQIPLLDLRTTSIDIAAPALALAMMIENREIFEARMTAMPPAEKQFLNPKELEYPGLPQFSAISHRITKVGWEDIALEYCAFWADEAKTVPATGYRFIRPLGSSRENPAPGSKIIWLEKWLQERAGEPVVIGAASVDTLNMIQALMLQTGNNYRLIRGGIDKKERARHINEFQAGKFRVMLLQQVAGSESVTLTKARYSILVDHDWSPITYTQFIHRTYRRGQKQKTEHYDLTFNDIQTMVLKRLLKGESFDAGVRQQIEERIGYSKFVQRFPIAK